MPSHAENISSEVDAVIEHDGPEKEILIRTCAAKFLLKLKEDMELTQTACDQILQSVDALFAEKMEIIQGAIRAAKIEKISTITSAVAERKHLFLTDYTRDIS